MRAGGLMLVAVGLGAHAMKESRDKDSVFTFALLLPALLLGLGLLSPYLALLGISLLTPALERLFPARPIV